MNLVVMISGKQGSGKTTLSKALFDWATNQAAMRVFSMKFADPLYEMHDAMSVALSRFVDPNPLAKTDGTLLQILGDWGRRQSPTFFVDILKKRVADLEKRPPQGQRLILIDDARFMNELAALDWGSSRVVNIRLEAGEHVRQGRAAKWRPDTNHASEIGLDLFSDFDRIIYTDTNDAAATFHVVKRYLEEIYAGKI